MKRLTIKQTDEMLKNIKKLGKPSPKHKVGGKKTWKEYEGKVICMGTGWFKKAIAKAKKEAYEKGYEEGINIANMYNHFGYGEIKPTAVGAKGNTLTLKKLNKIVEQMRKKLEG